MINTKGAHVLPMPESGRVLFWYGWPDDPENEDKKWLKKYLMPVVSGVFNQLFADV